MVVGISGNVVVMATDVSTVLGVGGSSSGAKVSLSEELNDVHELSVKIEMAIQRFILVRLCYLCLKMETLFRV